MARPDVSGRRGVSPARVLWLLVAMLPVPALAAPAPPDADAAVPVEAADPAAEAAARAAALRVVDGAAGWLPVLAVAGPDTELAWRARHARLATAARSGQAAAQWREVAALARAQSRHAVRRSAQSMLSNLGYRSGDLALTRALEEESLEDARRIGDRRDEAQSLQDLGLVHTITGDPALAEQRFREAIAIWETLHVPVGHARGLRGLARVQEMRGRYPEALELHVAALELMLAHGVPMEQSESYFSLARLFLNLQDHEAGLKAVGEALRLLGERPPDFPLGLNLAARSQLLLELDRVDEAVADGRASLAAFDRADAAAARAIGQLVLGQSLARAGDTAAGLGLLDDGIARARLDSEKVLLGDLLLAKGQALGRAGRSGEARRVLEEAFAIGEEMGLDPLRQNVALEMESLASARGDHAEALAWSRRAFVFRDRLAPLTALHPGTAASPAAAARARFMALEAAPAAAPAPAPATVVPAPPPPTATPHWGSLLFLPTLLLAWWLLRTRRAARRLKLEREALRARQRALESEHRDLRSQSERLRQQAAIDPLTGAMTRAAFASALEALLAQAGLQRRPVALLVFDLDRFKEINDRHGHLAGDAALRLATGVAREKLRSADLLGRFGGDEFLVALDGLDATSAESVAEAIRFEIALRAPAVDARMAGLTISVGLAMADGSRGHDAESLFRRADVALYRAKRAGRNRVVADAPGVAADGERRPRAWAALS